MSTFDPMTKLEYYLWPRKEILSFTPNNISTVLDLGCGGGYFGKSLKEIKDCIVWGVEPSSAASIAEQYLDRVFHAHFDQSLDFEGKKFDCIFFNDVLEHLENPHNALDTAKKNLCPNGYIVSSIPNILYFSMIVKIIKSQDWRYENSGILDKTHLRFFIKKSLIRMFEDCGLKILKIQGITPEKNKFYKFLNLLLLKKIEDMGYRQFLILTQLDKYSSTRKD